MLKISQVTQLTTTIKDINILKDNGLKLIMELNNVLKTKVDIKLMLICL